jgi:hypothetical protein
MQNLDKRGTFFEQKLKKGNIEWDEKIHDPVIDLVNSTEDIL